MVIWAYELDKREMYQPFRIQVDWLPGDHGRSKTRFPVATRQITYLFAQVKPLSMIRDNGRNLGHDRISIEIARLGPG